MSREISQGHQGGKQGDVLSARAPRKEAEKQQRHLRRKDQEATEVCPGSQVKMVSQGVAIVLQAAGGQARRGLRIDHGIWQYERYGRT